MPLFYFYCSNCQKKYRHILKQYSLGQKVSCVVCKSALERLVKAPTTQTTEIIDNGIMPKQVEKLMDVKELLEERSKKSEPLSPIELL